MNVTTKEFRALSTESVQVFISTLNSKGRTRVSIVRGPDAHNYKEGELLWQKEFSNWNRIPATALAAAKAAIQA